MKVRTEILYDLNMESANPWIGIGTYFTDHIIITCHHVTGKKRDLAVWNEKDNKYIRLNLMYGHRTLDYAVLVREDYNNPMSVSKAIISLGSLQLLKSSAYFTRPFNFIDTKLPHYLVCPILKDVKIQMTPQINHTYCKERVTRKSTVFTVNNKMPKNKLRHGTSGSPVVSKSGDLVGVHWGASKNEYISYVTLIEYILIDIVNKYAEEIGQPKELKLKPW